MTEVRNFLFGRWLRGTDLIGIVGIFPFAASGYALAGLGWALGWVCLGYRFGSTAQGTEAGTAETP